MKTEIISFYSDIDGRTYYSDHAKRLTENCKQFNIPYDIRELPSKGSYRLNCLSKPKFILSMMEEKKKPIVWLDVDSIIHNELNIFDDKENICDVVFAYQQVKVLPEHIAKAKASPIYLNYNDIVLEMIKYWIDMCEQNINNPSIKVFDHEILMIQVIPVFMSRLRIGALPINYAIWPGTSIPHGMAPMITMGIADGSSKEESLRELGMDEGTIKYNLVGNS